MSEIATTESDAEGSIRDTAFLDTVSNSGEKSWLISIKVNNIDVKFKLDTGAEVTAISEETFQLLNNCTLSYPEKNLYGPSRQPLEVLGKFEGKLAYYDNKSTIQPVYVVNKLKMNILGLPAITSLNLATRVDSVEYYSKGIMEKYPSVFNGLCNLGDEYEIVLEQNAKPFSLYTPRSIPIPLRAKVKKELERMESMGVTSKVEPTPWCAGMVAVPKKNGSVHICVDLQHLNKSVLREVHPLPKVDDILAQLPGARLFSKLDANSGFWQIPLAKKSQALTTFITPAGWYCFNKLPFGISSAPEHFQKRMSKILDGISGVLCLIDDVLVYGKNREEHNARLGEVLERLKEARVSLNPEKCVFCKSKLTFLGHLIDENGIQADPEKTTAIVRMKATTHVTELRRFLGMANQLGKFSPNLANLTQPLRELLTGEDPGGLHWLHLQPPFSIFFFFCWSCMHMPQKLIIHFNYIFFFSEEKLSR